MDQLQRFRDALGAVIVSGLCFGLLPNLLARGASQHLGFVGAAFLALILFSFSSAGPTELRFDGHADNLQFDNQPLESRLAEH